MTSSTPDREVSPIKAVITISLALILVIVMSVGGVAGCKSFNRSQKRADANNAVKVTAINIRKAQQQAKIVRAQNAAVEARAEQRLIEAKGIRAAQDEISATLTTKYLQHEAIKAQLAMANGQNHSVIYVPSGEAGVPLIRDTSGDGAGK